MQRLKNFSPVKTLVILMFIFVMALALSGFAPVEQGVQRFKEVVAEKLTVSKNGTIGGNLTITGALSADDVTITHVVGRATFLRYQDVAAAPSIRAIATVVSGTTSVSSVILGIETPRNVVLTYLTVTTATAGNVTVAGVDARGNSTTELIAVDAISGSQTLVGVVPWQSITSFTLPTRTENVTLTVAGGQKFGLPFIPETAGDLFHLTVNATPQTAPTVNATYGTFDPVSTPAASVDYNVWMKQ